jgi:AraC family transcriptional regulator
MHSERINRVCEYVCQNLDKEFSLDHLSELANFSKFHFTRQFSAYTGISVFKFIQLMRLKRASYSIAFFKNTRIIDIALDAQFESPESFSRAFKNSFGQTPTQFRKEPEWPAWHAKFQFSLPISEGAKTMNVKIVDFKKIKVALLEHRCSPDRVFETASKFIEWRKQSTLSPVKSSNTYGIAYDDPKTTDPGNFRFDICGSIVGDVPENPQGVKTGYIPSGRCAVIRHQGSHDNIDQHVHYLYGEWLPKTDEELRDFPCFFHYLNLINDVEECELLTDIYLPLKKN